MGMNVNYGTGVGSYTQKLPSTSLAATNSNTAAVNPFAQAQYDTVSFSGKCQQAQEKEEGMSTGAKVGLVAAAAAVVVGVVAASRGKKLNTANGESTKLWNNIKNGFKTFIGEGKKEYQKLVANSTDDIVKAATEAGKKGNSTKAQQGATKFTKETMETAGANAKKAQKKIASLNEQIANLDPKKDAEKIKALKKQIQQQQKQVDKFVNLTTSENLASDKAYTKLKEDKASAKEALDAATSKKTALEAKKTGLEKKKQAIENISKKKRTAEQTRQLQSYKDEIAKIDGKIQNIVNGTKDKNGKVLTKPLSELKADHVKQLNAAKQYKQAAKTLSEAQITATNNNQLYQNALSKKNGTLTPSQDVIARVDALKTQVSDSNTTLTKLKKAWEEFAKTGKYDEGIFGKIK